MFTYKSATDSVGTPDCILDAVTREFGEYFDPCPLNPKFDPKVDTDGLKIDWGPVNFVNPPFSSCKRWLMKAYNEWKRGKTSIVLLKSQVTNTKYFARYSKGAEIRFISHKVRFKGYTNYAWFPLMLVIFIKNKELNTFKCVAFE